MNATVTKHHSTIILSISKFERSKNNVTTMKNGTSRDEFVNKYSTGQNECKNSQNVCTVSDKEYATLL